MNRTIPNDVLERIRNKNDIVEIVKQYVQLEKKGSNYFGLCPFHDEKTPSFSVTKEKQIFRCFGCGKGGNVFTFIQEIESFSFIEAVEFLAERANIVIPRQRQIERHVSADEKMLLTAADWLTKYYHHLLKYTAEGEAGRSYLQERGIDDRTIDTFEVGLAPINSDVTVQFLQSKDIHLQVLVKSGLLTQREKDQYSDPFRGRIIYPIKDHVGKVVAFGARSIRGEEPKYLNSREHSLFRKGNLLYNFHLAKNEMRKEKVAILFEGYMDVLTAYQAGIKNVVATLGTALTEEQARLLRRYAKSVIVCYDGDDAGIQASYEAAWLLKKFGSDVKIASIPERMDPDTFILTYGGERFKKEVLATSDTFIKFMMKYKRRQYNLSLESEKIAYIEEVIRYLAQVDHEIEREFYVNELAEEFSLSRDVILRDITKHKNQNKQQAKSKFHPPPNIQYERRNKRNDLLPAYRNAERKLLTFMLKEPSVLEKVQQKLGIHFNLDEHKVILTHLYAIYEEKGKVDISELIDKLVDEQIRQIVTELAFDHTKEFITDEEINDCIHVIQHEATHMNELRILRKKQREAKDPLLAAQIGLEIIEMENKLKH